MASLLLAALVTTAPGAERVLDARRHHVRLGTEREWAEFPPEAEADRLVVTFAAEENPRDATLRLRHRDVKQRWTIALNDRKLGQLPPDGNDMVTFWTIPPHTLHTGENVLRITGAGKTSDDVLLGDVRLDDRPRGEVLGETPVEVTVRDETGRPLPCRLTLVDDDGALMSVGSEPNEQWAVRPGVVYTATGSARFTVPAGRYTLYAGRGFEYGIDSARLDAQVGKPLAVNLTIRREVNTDGWASCDTHCHTLTYSRHGDATIAERMVTLAGEGIELPVAADHNTTIDYDPSARAAGVRRYFTPIIGEEVTTPRLGHFNVFPIAPEASAIDYKGAEWADVFESVWRTPGVRVVVLNHARDLHGGFRPFDPRHHIRITGENLDGRTLRANAMEVVNSGATQTDPLGLYRDWFGLLNRGLSVAPVGASDSHDVSRSIVGQGRTYIRCDDRDPGRIDVPAACESFAAGHVLVSLGLFCEITVNGQYGPGDLAPASPTFNVALRVSGPTWTQVDHVTLYANGIPIREAKIDPDSPESRRGGVKWEQTWSLPRPRHDVHLAAVATGPGVRQPFWPIAKPYQPTAPEWQPYVIGSTGAVRLDADGSGRFESAHEIAKRHVTAAAGDIPTLLASLAECDEAVAAQAASLLREAGTAPVDPALTAALRTAAPAIRRGFETYATQWRDSQIARAMP